MLELFYIKLAYIVYTYIKRSCWSIKTIYLLLYVVYITNDMHLNYIHLHIITAGHSHV